MFLMYSTNKCGKSNVLFTFGVKLSGAVVMVFLRMFHTSRSSVLGLCWFENFRQATAIKYETWVIESCCALVWNLWTLSSEQKLACVNILGMNTLNGHLSNYSNLVSLVKCDFSFRRCLHYISNINNLTRNVEVCTLANLGFSLYTY